MEDTANLISDGVGGFLRHFGGAKKGEPITLIEFSAMSTRQQTLIMVHNEIKNDPVKSAALSVKMKAARNKVLSDPVKSAALSDKLKAAHERLKSDPVKAEKAKNDRKKTLSDPAKYEAYLASLKAAAERLRNDPVKAAAKQEKRRATLERNRLAKLAAQDITSPKS